MCPQYAPATHSKSELVGGLPVTTEKPLPVRVLLISIDILLTTTNTVQWSRTQVSLIIFFLYRA